MQVHSFQNTIVLVNGVEIVGWSEGDDVISIKRRVDAISDKVGAGGAMMVSISSDKSGEFAFKLQQGSSSNNYLGSIASSEELGAEFFIPVRVTFQDIYRQDLASGSVGYVKRPSDMVRGAAANTQEWTLVVERLDMVLGFVPEFV